MSQRLNGVGPSASGSNAQSCSPAQARPGSNWKALKKTLVAPAAAGIPLHATGTAVVMSKMQLTKSRHKAFKRTGELERQVQELHMGRTESRTNKQIESKHSVHLTSGLSKSKGKARQIDVQQEISATSTSSSPKTGSPAPTTLPWFADDLSPADLALVRQIQEGGNAVMQVGAASVLAGGAGVGSEIGGKLTADGAREAALKKRVIFGGWDDSASEEKKAPGSYLAIDCEMVGVGPRGAESALARVSIVNFHGFTIFDTFVRTRERVTDYRTWVSGVRAADLHGAPLFSDVQKQVAKLIEGRTLVGHALSNDLTALQLTHPRYLIRDTSSFEPLCMLAGTKRPSLRALVRLTLGIEIQKEGEEHSSVEDARATMAVFRTQKAQWDAMLRKGGQLHQQGGSADRDAEGQETQTQKQSEGGTKRKRDSVHDTVPGAKKQVNGGKRGTPSQPGWWKASA
ncbi:hypothetical protein K437DRAFT_257978 [Tilletiaria anomala UBC 951]|uniref:RNA exonuclease 4 n=1 Tax=Tilletiaria anomala (strain ATCC 24038 / CBS 436.72 / UBC 951) TaxID=1037660 RepID=A0A066VL42_TILAU|nr:uncharacterized protein K437DRAFT_257978 [Tilletiaria anomala UBC 951]KDN42201.1 hypothetical protein K437DRAFT_257978 [Tilletiaria anomala UBC 951]